MLEQLLDAIGRLKEIGDAQEDWDLRQKWVQAQIGKLWQRRGLYPGLLTVMDLLDAEASIKNAKRSEEHTSELQSLMRISYAVFCLKKKKQKSKKHTRHKTRPNT